LQRQQCAVFEVVEGDRVGQVLAQVADIVPLRRAVDDDVVGRCPALRDIGDHKVVEDPAALVEQQRIADVAGLERGDIAREQRLERLGRALPADHELAHVADVEQTRVLARPLVLGDDAPTFAGVLHRHGVAREGHHACAAGAVPGIERQCRRPCLEFDIGVGSFAHHGLRTQV
jgi:hypothetical protein